MAIDLAVDYAPYVDELFTQESKKDLLTKFVRSDTFSPPAVQINRGQ